MPCEEWSDRDSYMAQVMVSTIHKALTADIPFIIQKRADERYIWIEFEGDMENLKNGIELQNDDRDDYFERVDPVYETEMFDASGIDKHHKSGFMPTRERLNEADGYDWY